MTGFVVDSSVSGQTAVLCSFQRGVQTVNLIQRMAFLEELSKKEIQDGTALRSCLIS